MEASEVLSKLRSLGHEYGPDKQTYKAGLGETKVTVFNRRGQPKLVHARDLEQHIASGMSLTEEEAFAANPGTEEAVAAAAPVARGRK